MFSNWILPLQILAPRMPAHHYPLPQTVILRYETGSRQVFEVYYFISVTDIQSCQTETSTRRLEDLGSRAWHYNDIEENGAYQRRYATH